MDNPYSPSPFELASFYQNMGLEELKQELMHSTADLEMTRITAQEELSRMEEMEIQIKQVLDNVARERDEARESSNALLHHLLCLTENHQQQQQQSESEESIVSSPQQQQQQQPPVTTEALELPEKGRLLEAVMKAGPLLQTLMLAGPLPTWRVPPPPLQGFEIPPVNIDCGGGGSDLRKECNRRD
ncbi:hypothetical protein QJS10_CPA09g01879 [Acorus calamus]|uniref:Uncharacterized protein n=1 Tax=Acorus calamus TaxID=4465 RepID=A0AAV9E4E6_ACOCL|nr:hypothetical protein QJS10_CPA09g01879 [Acorus calamus]